MALLDYLAMFAQACQLEIPDEDLICDACPAGAVTDKEYQRAMRARSLIACRRVVPDVFEAVLLRLAVIVLAVLAWH